VRAKEWGELSNALSSLPSSGDTNAVAQRHIAAAIVAERADDRERAKDAWTAASEAITSHEGIVRIAADLNFDIDLGKELLRISDAMPEGTTAAILQLETIARGYSTLEYDLETGRRGERGLGVERWLRRLTGAEAALVVNNGAAAVLLTLSAVAAGRAVIVSRGELVEIGGSFRIPEILEKSGATLVEVGTTNRTHLRDYQRALEKHRDAGAILRVHPSNFRIAGFSVKEIRLTHIPDY
jgi:seryl-tRNA(Sec) selenium transferase